MLHHVRFNQRKSEFPLIWDSLKTCCVSMMWDLPSSMPFSSRLQALKAASSIPCYTSACNVAQQTTLQSPCTRLSESLSHGTHTPMLCCLKVCGPYLCVASFHSSSLPLLLRHLCAAIILTTVYDDITVVCTKALTKVLPPANLVTLLPSLQCVVACCRLSWQPFPSPASSHTSCSCLLQAVMAALSLFCFITCVLASCAPTAYSDTMPKRVVLQHHNQHDAAGNVLATRSVHPSAVTFVCLLVCLSVCVPVSQSVCMSVYVPLCLCPCVSVHMCGHLSVSLSVNPSMCPSVCAPVCQSICVFICLSVSACSKLVLCACSTWAG